jgi:hypothetical protein
MSSYIYAFIRQDISPEQRIVQVGHACYEAGKLFNDDHGISSLILLPAKDEDDIKDIAYRLGMRGIDFYAFFEPDNNMGISALCTHPITSKADRRFFRKWSLFKDKEIA